MLHTVLILVFAGCFYLLFGRLAAAAKRISERKTDDYRWLENTILSDRKTSVLLAVGLILLATAVIYIVSAT